MRRYLTLLVFVSTSALADTPVIDRSGAWDVNQPLGPSRTLEFTTDEGTWMNLDVHPDGSEIIFDLLGDLHNGVVYDASSMNQLWPREVERGRFFFDR